MESTAMIAAGAPAASATGGVRGPSGRAADGLPFFGSTLLDSLDAKVTQLARLDKGSPVLRQAAARLLPASKLALRGGKSNSDQTSGRAETQPAGIKPSEAQLADGWGRIPSAAPAPLPARPEGAEKGSTVFSGKPEREPVGAFSEAEFLLHPGAAEPSSTFRLKPPAIAEFPGGGTADKSPAPALDLQGSEVQGNGKSRARNLAEGLSSEAVLQATVVRGPAVAMAPSSICPQDLEAIHLPPGSAPPPSFATKPTNQSARSALIDASASTHLPAEDFPAAAQPESDSAAGLSSTEVGTSTGQPPQSIGVPDPGTYPGLVPPALFPARSRIVTASISAGGADRRAVTAAEVADELQQTAGRATAGANGVGDTAGAAGAIDSRSSRGDSIAPAEAFRHIDTGDASVPRWLHLNPHMVEAGIDDPVHGWVEVRAQGGPGQVLASVSAASPEAHAALHAQLAGMSEYLAAREIGVHTLGVADPGAGGGPASQTGSQGSSTGDSPPRKEENNLPLSPHAREGPARDGAQPVPGQELKSASLHLISVRA